MKFISRFIAYLQYLLFRCVGFIYELVPASRSYSIGFFFTRSFYRIFKNRRAIAIDNILKAGVAESHAEADNIARKAFGHLGGHILEAFKVNKVINKENWREHITFECAQACHKLVFEELDQPFILLTAHLGSWEVGVSIASHSRPMIAIARTMNNPFVEEFMRRHHFRDGITVVDKNKGFSADVLRQWKKSASALAIVMDQRAGRKNGIDVDFMGRTATTHTSPARLHLRTGLPVVIGAIVRESPFHYRLIADDPIQFAPTDNRGKDIKELLTLFNKRLETIIRRYPEQYLWAHNRWR